MKVTEDEAGSPDPLGSWVVHDSTDVKKTIMDKVRDGYESFGLSIWDVEKNEELDWKSLIEIKYF